MSLLHVSEVYRKEGNNFVVKNISFTQNQFQKIAVAGETGSGKSTLLKMIAGLVQPTSGAIYFENKRVLGPEEKLLPGHQAIAYLSQHFELRSNYKVRELLLMANKITDEEANIIYNICRISHLLNRKTDQLSGGEKQRIAMASLLTAAPKLLLLDEPFSNLDTPHKNMMKAVVRDISDILNITCLLVSHDPVDILSWADEIMVMKDGQIIQKGTPQQVYKQPVNEYTAALFGTYNLISVSLLNEFATLFDISINGRDICVRPENFTIVSYSEGALKGKVNKVLFCGSYYELEVQVHRDVLTVKTHLRDIKEGDSIYLYLSPEDVGYV
ncbi:ABC transporter ATP-binding protein [Ilyomonas limi]|uniref:ABC transporter ATP-binding protein n=1 Tax=Ilyomonas limi TaxID=2575867 RepID=A0A4U3KT75_9BACT|nr:ABC transporter ATP-binding protein [Ilyomonas limi]TKK64909.1 ABC transporter ATP-binding protein [Ilyomonas limi]